MIDRSAIQAGMEVWSSDGTLQGRVGRVEGDRLHLTEAASPAARDHLIPISWIARVDRHVHLNVTAAHLAANSTTSPAAAGAAPGPSTVGSSIPPTAGPLGAGGALGLGAAGADPKADSSAASTGGPALPPVRNPAVEGAKPRRNYYLPWILGLLLLLLLLFVGLRSCDNDEADRRDREEPARETRAVDRETERRDPARYETGTIAYDLDRFLASDEPAPRTLTFDRLNFDTGSASIRPDYITDLDQIAQIMNAHPATRIAIIGYTDARGSGRANARLGRERAESIVDGLVTRGISRERLESRSGGEDDPVGNNRSAQGLAENRRTELIVLTR